jgi:ATP-dependent RNA helicase RhlE
MDQAQEQESEHSFYEFDLAEPILKAVREEGYKVPTPIQVQAIPLIMEGHDVLGCAQTGTGKTAAFALPMIHRLTQCRQPPRNQIRKVRALILTPTRELASQIAESFRTYGKHCSLKHALVFGGVGSTKQIKAIKPGVDILVATPGRLLDLLQQEHVDLGHVEILVLDEADRMLDMGFLPDVQDVIRELPTARQTLFFSATMPPDIADLASRILRDPIEIHVTPETPTVEKIDQFVYFVEKRNKLQLLVHYLMSRNVTRALVFVKMKHHADRVAMQLVRNDIKADAIHSDKTQLMREKALSDFRAGRVKILVATDIAARGIDVDGITHVLNYDVPRDLETYVHRIGRTARAGAQGVSVTFCEHEDRLALKAIERFIRRTLIEENDHPQYPKAPPPPPASEDGSPAADGAAAARNRRRRDRPEPTSSVGKERVGGVRPDAKPKRTVPREAQFRSAKQGKKRSGQTRKRP